MKTITEIENDKNRWISAIKEENRRLMDQDLAKHASHMDIIKRMRDAARRCDVSELTALREQLTRA